MPLLISDATVIDGVSDEPRAGLSVWIDRGRIEAIGRRDEFGTAPSADVIDATGKYVIPGLLNANVHLYGGISIERLAMHYGRYEEVIAESAQIALKHGLTTVFDTWGPRRPLMNVRDQINAGEIPGSRIFCAGNIIGFDGPFSPDFMAKAADVTSASLARRVNAIWVENVGRHLMWLTPSDVAKQIAAYISKGIDFIKYGSNEHFAASAGAFLCFSPAAQAAMVAEAHRAGVTAQAHCMSVEGLRIAVEAGCDLITHCNITGPVPIPDSTLELMAKRKTGAVIFPWTQKGLDWVMSHVGELERAMWEASDTNARKFIQAGAPLLLANDGMVLGPEVETDPFFASSWSTAPLDDSLISLSHGHVNWFRAMEEKGCPPMEMLRAATRNIAVAYGKDKDLGTLEPGKVADLVILDEDPLAAAKNYGAIGAVIKDGAVVDRDALPLQPVLTKPLEPAEEEASYIPFLSSAAFPMCPMCMWH